MKNILLLIILSSGLLSCSKEPNNFSQQANAFLDAIDNKEYNGVEGAAGSTFKVNGKLIAEYASTPTIALEFQNTTGDGASSTDGIYRQTRTPEQWQGIRIENGGATLLRTDLASISESIDWTTLKIFAQQK